MVWASGLERSCLKEENCVRIKNTRKEAEVIWKIRAKCPLRKGFEEELGNSIILKIILQC